MTKRARGRRGEAAWPNIPVTFRVPNAMRTLLSIVLLAAAHITLAQDWALLNPAYRYNYSNDGTDTISNQIRVMDVDTLGVDSVRYVLNQVDKACTTCGDTCDVLIDIPQFLQRESQFSNGVWSLRVPEELRIRPQALLNEEWVFDLQNGTTGVIMAITEENIFGNQDSVRTMITALDDTVTWSKSFGILHWHMHDQPAYRLVGIHGPQVGNLIPTLQEFFRYQAGDIAQFLYYSCSQQHCSRRYQKFEIAQRTEENGQIEFSGPLYQRYVAYDGSVSYSFNPTHTWVIDSAANTNLLPLRSWPGQGMTLNNMGSWFINNDLYLLARHYRDVSGAYVITGEVIRGQTLSDIYDSTITQCLRMASSNGSNNYRLDTRIGLRLYSRGFGYEINSFETLGAVIGGDTIGTLQNDAFYNIVGIDELDLEAAQLFPNPASEQINVPRARAGSEYCIMDMVGRIVICDLITDTPVIDVRLLQPGQYILKMQETYPQRLIIAR
jgi:hypothetical protein